MVSRFHLDTDFLVTALAARGEARAILTRVAESSAELEMSAIAWYEFCRGPRRPEEQAVARDLLEPNGIITFDEGLAAEAADLFRRMGSPRKRAVDIAIAISAMSRGARLLTGNTRDYSGIEGLLLGEARVARP